MLKLNKMLNTVFLNAYWILITKNLSMFLKFFLLFFFVNIGWYIKYTRVLLFLLTIVIFPKIYAFIQSFLHFSIFDNNFFKVFSRHFIRAYIFFGNFFFIEFIFFYCYVQPQKWFVNNNCTKNIFFLSVLLAFRTDSLGNAPWK